VGNCREQAITLTIRSGRPPPRPKRSRPISIELRVFPQLCCSWLWFVCGFFLALSSFRFKLSDGGVWRNYVLFHAQFGRAHCSPEP
jgi:hypothetical protein